MPLLARTIATPVAIEVRAGAIGALGPLLADGRISSGGKVAIAVGTGRGDGIAAQLRTSLPEASVVQVEGGSLDAALHLIEQLRGEYHDAVVGIGGGRTLDAAKYAASLVGLPFVSVPTTLTHDGIASPVASLDAHGRKASFGVHTPIAVFVDLDHVREAPLEHTRSGIGDALSNLSAIADWELAREVNGEAVDGLAVSFARSAAEAVAAAAPDGDGFLTTVADGLILSGIAMAVAGSSRPCSGACHEILHAMDALLEEPHLHGLQAAFGARFATWRRGDDDLLATLDAAMLRHGLPRHPEQFDLSEARFAEVLLAAPDMRPGRFTILEHDPITPDRVANVIRDYLTTIV
jgi:glycerol-1-phosphate dehydrogenase [NAD(P)+]